MSQKQSRKIRQQSKKIATQLNVPPKYAVKMIKNLVKKNG